MDRDERIRELEAALRHTQQARTAAEQRALAMEEAYRREIRRGLPPWRHEREETS